MEQLLEKYGIIVSVDYHRVAGWLVVKEEKMFLPMGYPLLVGNREHPGNVGEALRECGRSVVPSFGSTTLPNKQGVCPKGL